jgi:cbb3-type cytochrome oxidase maturation protein
MEILILLIPLSVVIALGIGVVFWWSAENGQFDDLEGPGNRILMDDDKPKSEIPPSLPLEKGGENR